MKSVVIEQVSEKRTIHDLASDQYDREIKFRGDCKYAVVLASYYGGNQYTTHKTFDAACTASRRCKSSHVIIDIDGNILYPDQRKRENLFSVIADSVIEESDEELITEIEGQGLDPQAVADTFDTIFKSAILAHNGKTS